MIISGFHRRFHTDQHLMNTRSPSSPGTQGQTATSEYVLLRRLVTRVSRARWFSFVRRVFQYQNGSRSDVLSNPFNSGPWLALEFLVLVVQISGIAATMTISRKEDPDWPLRIWAAGYNLGSLLSLPLVCWRYSHSRTAGASMRSDYDIEQQRSNEESRSYYLMNKSRTYLELFFALWFVMGNVWVFDPKNGALHRDPKLHSLCILILIWNAISYSFPFMLFLLLCCCVPFISRVLGYNMNLASTHKGASDDQISKLPCCRFKQVEHKNQPTEIECCICLAKYVESEQVRQLPCSHIFHLECVDQWLKIMSCCPLCKGELDK